jgi:small redox-active disulfide protein 2
MQVLVLGPGCANCRKTYELAQQAVDATGVKADVQKVEDLVEISKYVMLTPGVVVDGDVKCAGRMPALDEIEGWLREAASSG